MLISQRFPKIINLIKKKKNKTEAQTLFKTKISKLIKKLIIEKNLKLILELEQILYVHLIRIYEDSNHCKKIYREFDRIMDGIKESVSNEYPELKRVRKTNSNEVTFFIHSLVSEMAHIEVFEKILSLRSDTSIKIKVFGFCPLGISISKILERLSKKEMIALDVIYYDKKMDKLQMFLKMVEYIYFSKSKNIIFLSLPIYLVILTKIFNNIGIFILKFDYDKTVFSNLSKVINPLHLNFDYWTKEEIFKLRKNIKLEINQKKIVLYTINRSVKINDPNYIKLVLSILQKHKNTVFHYASDTKCDDFERMIGKKDLDKRVHYLGWVNIKERIQYGDIFLDTENISGTVAKKHFMSGIPTVFFLNNNFSTNGKYCNSKVKLFLNNFDLKHKFIKKIFLRDRNYEEEKYNLYRMHLNNIINNLAYRNEYINVCKLISDKFFINRNIDKFIKDCAN